MIICLSDYEKQKVANTLKCISLIMYTHALEECEGNFPNIWAS